MVINKRALTFIVAILLLLMSAVIHFYSDLVGEKDSWKSSYESSAEAARYWHNKNGESQAEIKNSHVTIEVLKQQHNKELDSLSQVVAGLKKNLSNIQTFTSVSVVTAGSISAPITLSPVIGHPNSTGSFAYSDRWLNISGYFLRDSVNLKYRISDDIQVVQLWKRPRIFAHKELYTDVISKNPNSEISLIKTISIRQPIKSRFGIVVFAGADTQLKPTVGVGVGYQLIQF